jgi:hypothetical protein
MQILRITYCHLASWNVSGLVLMLGTLWLCSTRSNSLYVLTDIIKDLRSMDLITILHPRHRDTQQLLSFSPLIIRDVHVLG